MVATVKRILLDACHARRNRHRRQSAAAGKRIRPDARHALLDRHRRQSAARIERIIPDARYVSADFNYLRFFYPIVGISIKQSGVDHRLLIYFS